MPGAKYSAEFKNQVVREVIDKDRTIAAVAESYGLVAQTVGVWVRQYRDDHPEPDSVASSDSDVVARLKKELREAQMENEFLKKAAAFFARTQQ